MPRKVPKPASEGADVEDMLSIEVEESAECPPEPEPTPDEPTRILVRCKVPMSKRSDGKRCYRADTFMETEEWAEAHEADLERI